MSIIDCTKSDARLSYLYKTQIVLNFFYNCTSFFVQITDTFLHESGDRKNFFKNSGAGAGSVIE